MHALILPATGNLGPLSQRIPVSLLPLFGRPILEHLLVSWPGLCLTVAALEHPEHLEARFPDLRVFLAKPEQGPREIWQRAAIKESCLVIREGSLIGDDLLSLFEFHQAGPHPITVLRAPGGAEIGLIADPEVEDPWDRDQPHQVIQIKGYADAASPPGYLSMHREALFGRFPLVIPGVERSPGVWVEAGARIHPQVKIEAPCWISRETVIERECVLCDAYLEGRVRLERGVKLTGAVALDKTRAGKGSQWSNQILSECYAIGREVQTHEPDLLRAIGGRKRDVSLDALLAAVLLVALSPLLLLIALVIYLDSPGPIFYSQLRVGQNRRNRWGYPQTYRGQVFDLYKFRTMQLGADQKQAKLSSGELFYKPQQDPRVTRIGNLLRKTSLDELPQLVNVIKGNLRIVGNRPLPLYEAERLDQPWQWRRFDAPAGITGLWQISGRSDLSDTERLVLDSYYATHRSFWGDLGILFKTLPALLSRRGAR